MTNAVVQKLANEFDQLLHWHMSADDYRDAVHANIDDDQQLRKLAGFDVYTVYTSCHTHDYIDSNETMEVAFQNVIGRPSDVSNDADTALWNSAWSLWRADKTAAIRQLTPDGYRIVGTGGGCDAFQRDIYFNGRHVGYVWITDKNDPSIPDYTDVPVTLGVYGTDGTDDTLMVGFDCACTADAVAIAAKITVIGEQ